MGEPWRRGNEERFSGDGNNDNCFAMGREPSGMAATQRLAGTTRDEQTENQEQCPQEQMTCRTHGDPFPGVKPAYKPALGTERKWMEDEPPGRDELPRIWPRARSLDYPAATGICKHQTRNNRPTEGAATGRIGRPS